MPIEFARYFRLFESQSLQPVLKRVLALGIAVSTLCIFPMNATSQSADVTFTGNVTVSGDTCVIQVLNDGQISASANLRVLDSRRWGGFGAQILVTSRRPAVATGPGFEISFDPPTSFAIAPAGTSTNINWRVWHQGTSVSNGLNFTRRRGFRSQTLPATGVSVTQIEGHLRARNNDGPYPEGTYRAVGTYRCE